MNWPSRACRPHLFTMMLGRSNVKQPVYPCRGAGVCSPVRGLKLPTSLDSWAVPRPELVNFLGLLLMTSWERLPC